MRAIPAPLQRRTLLGTLRAGSFAGLVSLRYFLLRSSNAGFTLVAGLIQTFVFARIVTPEDFSIFILMGTLGVSMWLFDLGLPKILFVRLRSLHLAGQKDDTVAGQANAVALLYVLIIFTAAFVSFAVLASRPTISAFHAAEFTAFFMFSALNLVWFVLRNLSVAVDEFIFFETLEALRRAVQIGAMLAMLAGLPLAIFLIAVNLMWVLLFAFAVRKLLRRNALTTQMRGIFARLGGFFHENKQSALRTSTHAASELYIHNILYLAVPVIFGLGAPTIIADTTMKVFFGTLVLYSAACDVVVPRQTSAYAERDPRTLVRATLVGAILCAFPAVAISGLLFFGAEPLFALLLGKAATMPAAAAPILTVLLASGIVKTVANSLLMHTGYFREIARLSFTIAILLTAAIAAAKFAGLDITGVLQVYAAIYAAGAIFYIALAFRGPIQTARDNRVGAT